MLVLTRKQAETIRVGKDIVLKVIQTGRGSVRLGIEAPADVKLLRGELAEWPIERKVTVDVAEAVNLDEGERPLVAEACLAPVMAASRKETRSERYEETLPGRSIRRILSSYRNSLATTAK